jgi:hypothetical protein
MARLLSSNEADCLINQHRKQSWFPTKNHLLQTECIPRERFSPLADLRLLGLWQNSSRFRARLLQGSISKPIRRR